MKRGRSIGNRTKAQLTPPDVSKGVGCIFCHYTRLTHDDVRAEFWEMAGQNRRVA